MTAPVRLRNLVVIVALCALIAGRVSVAQERIDLPTRPGVTQPVYITTAPAPKASVILFPGGGGIVAQVRNNFLLRVASRFVAQGMTVAVIDTPSDHPSGMGAQMRATADHVIDIAAVVALLKTRSPAPIWLIGTSRGSISAANAAANIGPPRIAGVVLTSSVWQGGMASITLGQIRVPVLVVHNRDDGCDESPFRDTTEMMNRMRQATVKELVAVSGGGLRSGPCNALSPHGYYTIEDQVVPTIIAWIKAH
jgi:alpha-beta hydrolase superfamily lysophospholipase